MSKSSSSLIKREKHDQETRKKGTLEKIQTCQILELPKFYSFWKTNLMEEGLENFYHFATFPGTMCIFGFLFLLFGKLLNTSETHGHDSEPTNIFYTYYVLGDSVCISISIMINLGYYFYYIWQMRKEAQRGEVTCLRSHIYGSLCTEFGAVTGT